MLTRRRLVTTLVATPFASGLPRAAFAAYPEKPIKLIVPFAPGGNADFVARLCGEGMRASLGQPFVVENRAGAGGSLGAELAAKAAPDGYTLFLGSNGPLTVNPFVQAKLPYDPLHDFVAIGLANLAPHCIAVHESVRARTLAELIALSKTEPVNIGTSGAGSATHMTVMRFNAATGAKLEHVPYRGGGAIVPDLLAGNTTGAMTELSTVLPHIGSGKIRVLAVASAKRAPKAPDVPTMIEQSVPDFTAASYVGILAPAKTPADIVKALETALIKALNDTAVQEKFLNTGAELVTDNLMTSAGFGDFIKREFDLTREAAKLAGLTPT
jgi:tripartite-type tricarboxylate transporter receptor subunit TctC